jgi:alcohol dehydrogenase
VAGRVALGHSREQRLARTAEVARDRMSQRIHPSREKMEALVAYPGARLKWRSVPVPPSPGALGAIVHPIAVATCDMDPVIALGRTPFPLPLHLGHECVAEVLTVGSDVRTIRPGQRVVVPFQISCGECPPCRHGRTGNCDRVPPVAMYGFGVAGGLWGGALADQLAVPFADAMLVPLPDGIEPSAAASVADNVCDAYRHIAPHLPRLSERGHDSRVLIVGALSERIAFSASVPLYAALIAKAMGVSDVTVIDARPYARAHAQRIGVNALEPRELRGLAPAPLVVDLTTTGAGLGTSLTCVSPDGICTSAGTLHRTARVPALLAFGRNVNLNLGRAHARAIIPDVLELVQASGFAPEAVTTTLAPIEDAPAALRDHYMGGGVKTILTA